MKENIYGTQVHIFRICPGWKLKITKSQITWDSKLIKNPAEYLMSLNEKKIIKKKNPSHQEKNKIFYRNVHKNGYSFKVLVLKIVKFL